jgi:hypothetical protein
MTDAVSRHIGGVPQTYVSPIAQRGASIVAPAGPQGRAVQV